MCCRARAVPGVLLCCVVAAVIISTVQAVAVASFPLQGEAIVQPHVLVSAPWSSSKPTADSSASARKLRLVGVELPFGKDMTVRVRYAMCDTEGNILLNPPPKNLEFSLELSVHPDASPFLATLFPEISSGIERLRLVLCVDGSIATDQYSTQIAAALARLAPHLDSSDTVAIVAARAAPALIAAMTPSYALPSYAMSTDAFSGRGISRIAYACLWSLHSLKPRTLIIITGSDDYGMLDVLPSDVVEHARTASTAIWCIVLGNRVEAAPWEFIATHTGGKCYRVSSLGQSQSLEEALEDIIRSFKFSSRGTAAIPASFAARLESGCTVGIVSRGGDSLLGDWLVAPPASAATPPRQIIALFASGSSTIDSIYLPLLDALAAVLRENPTQAIELIGHAYQEGKRDTERQLAADRVRAVAAALRTRGVLPAQLRLRALGDLIPIYPVASSAAEHMLNRRVEFRWLDPRLLPYELVVGYMWSETEALAQQQRWQERGFNAYIEEVVIEQRPAFRVKLWGYATYQEAEAAARSIAQRYKVRVTVE